MLSVQQYARQGLRLYIILSSYESLYSYPFLSPLCWVCNSTLARVSASTSFYPQMCLSIPIPFSPPCVECATVRLPGHCSFQQSSCVECATVRSPGRGGRISLRIAHHSHNFRSIRTFYVTCCCLSCLLISLGYIVSYQVYIYIYISSVFLYVCLCVCLYLQSCSCLNTHTHTHTHIYLSLIHIWRCRRIERCRSRWSPYH